MQLLTRLERQHLDQLFGFAARELALLDGLAIDEDMEWTKQVNLQSWWRRSVLAHAWLQWLLLSLSANHSRPTRRSRSANRESWCRLSRAGSTLSSIKSGWRSL